MKKILFAALPLLLALCVAGIFAQSRRAAPDSNVPVKANKREPKPAETPQASPSPIPETAAPSEQPTAETNAVGAVDEKDVIRVNTQLVTIPVKVSDRGGKFVAGLTKENFTIFEDGKPQEIAYFSNVEEPFTVALLLDMSYSAKFKVNEIQSAAIAFVNQLHPNDKIMVVSFDEEVHVLCEPTNDRKVLQSAIRSTNIASGTSLYEAIDLVINKRLKKISGRKAIVLFTDGVDTTSRRASDFSNLSDVYELDALIYPIEYDTYSDVQAMKNQPVTGNQSGRPTIPDMPSRNPSPLPFLIPTGGVGTPSSQGTSAEDYRKAHEYLQQLAARTSGRIYEASTTANLSDAFTNIAGELRQIYSLGFYPAEEKEGKRRQLKVKVDQKGVAVQARDSYVVGKKEKGKSED
ncbi:MAG: VWA domain-containing protein [Pyrinomonadaceae bacterium]